MSPQELSLIRSQAGKKGGSTTLNKYGPEYYTSIGKLGGRPRNQTLAELKAQNA
jgi:hypothetical protein